MQFLRLASAIFLTILFLASCSAGNTPVRTGHIESGAAPYKTNRVIDLSRPSCGPQPNWGQVLPYKTSYYGLNHPYSRKTINPPAYSRTHRYPCRSCPGR